MRLSSKQQGHLLMFIVMGIFGLNIPVNKYLFSYGLISPFGLVALRMGFAALAFWLISFFMPKEKVSKRDMLVLLVGGLSGIFINQSLFAYGLSLTSPVDASIITTSSPLFALIIAAIILKEPITLKKAGGVLVGGLGALFLIYSTHQGIIRQDPSLIGDLGVLGAQLFYSFYLVVTRPLSMKYSSITMMKWMFTYSALISIPLFHRNILDASVFQQERLFPYLMISFVLVGATFITFLLIPMAQKRIRPTTISMYNNMQPLVTSSIAIYLGQDSFTLEKLIAAILIFLGVYLVTTSKSREDIEKSK